MNQLNSGFVVSKLERPISDGKLLEKDDVGILEYDAEMKASIFFVKIWQRVTLTESEFERFDVRQTGDSYAKKICNICHKLLDTTQFSRNQNGVNNRPIRRPSCRNCRKLLEGIDLKHKARVFG